jgi:hypothetical protein
MKTGRPSKLTPETTERLLQALRIGSSYEAACAYAGIDYSTFRKWMQKGERAKSGRFFEFFKLVKRAELEAELLCVRSWIKQIPEDWRAAKEFLERRFPERWGRSVKVEQDSPFRVILEDDTPDSV